MGKLFKRDDSEYWYADYVDRYGRRRKVSTRTADRQVARERLHDLELATTDRGSYTPETFDAALKYFVDVACAARPAPTLSSYKQKACHLARLLDGILVDELNRERIERYIASRLDEGAHPHSVHKELVVLRGAISSSSERRKTTTTTHVVPKFKTSYTPRTTYLTPHEFEQLVEHLVPPAHLRAKDDTIAARTERRNRRALYCLLIALASPRSGEVETMRWEHVDLQRGLLRVPKGKTISRVVAIHPVLRPWLEAMHQSSGLIVDRWANVRRDLPRASERAGVPRCTPNDLRRTFASWLVQAGTSLLVVSRLLGHSSTRMVDMVYGQLDESTLNAAIQRMPGGDAWDGGGTRSLPSRGTGGAGGTSSDSRTGGETNEKTTVSGGSVVPKDRVELPTRGFSVPAPEPRSRGANASRLMRKLKAV